MNDISILIVDDHAIVRTGLAGMLADVNGINVIGEAENGRSALTLVEQLQPDVVLMDLRMPEMDGPTAIARLRSSFPQLGILVLTTYDSDADILKAIESGANGYLLKDTSREDLLTAIRATAEGWSWLAPHIANRVMNQIRRGDQPALSDRELEVLRLVAKGQSNKEIATSIHVSQATVKSHLIHIFRTLDVNDRTAAVTVALERGIISVN